jgi:hypothetical protein
MTEWLAPRARGAFFEFDTILRAEWANDDTRWNLLISSLSKGTKVVGFHALRSGPTGLYQDRGIFHGIHLLNACGIPLQEAQILETSTFLWRIVISPMIHQDSLFCYDSAMRNLSNPSRA